MNERVDDARLVQRVEVRKLREVIDAIPDVLRPPEDLTVSEAAERYRQVYNPGAYVGPWRNSTTPYLVDFMDVLESDEYRAAVFVGPAQCGKSDMFFNWLTYKVACDPTDMIFYDAAKHRAEEWSKVKLERVLEHTPVLADSIVDRVVFRVEFRQRMNLIVSWPSKANFAGRSVGSLWLADYDRMDVDIGGEGAPFALARKRATTFGRRAMVVAESSPSFPIDHANWTPETPHEAPPAFGGILPIYNQGDRRRWYWRCVCCGHAFEPSWKTVRWDDIPDITEASHTARIECPQCQARYHDSASENTPARVEMNRHHARWIGDGQVWRKNGEVEGKLRRTDIASFWLKGPAATFVTLQGLVFDYLSALRTFEQTGEDQELRAVTNVSLAEPYIPVTQQHARTPEVLRNRARPLPEKEVPEGVRFLVAAIDVQKRWFVVQVIGIGAGLHGDPDWWVIDRFNIYKSRRLDEDGERKRIDPASHPEDWRQLVEEVLLRTYPLADGSGRVMRIHSVVSDSAGLRGATEAAYKFVYWLRHGGDDGFVDETGQPLYVWEPGLDARFHLVRGRPSGPRVKLTFPDSGRRDRYAVIRGEVPVWELNTQVLKDSVDAMLMRDEPGGMVHFPEWLPGWFYEELCAEIKDPKKGWINPHRRRNEAWDLMVYAKAATLMPDISIEKIDWTDPPPFAREWDENDNVFDPSLPDSATPPKEDEDQSLEDLGGLLA